MSKVVRLGYICPKSNSRKFLQTNQNKHQSKEKAKEFLILKRDAILQTLKCDEKIEPKLEDPIEPDEPTIEEKITTKDEFVNLIDQPMEANKQIDEIISNLKYSPFKLEIDPKETPSSLVIFGSSRSYKTTLLKRIMKKYYKDDVIVILCATNSQAKIYDEIDKDIIKTDQYSSEIISAMHKINKKTNNRYSFVVILDDVIDSKSDINLEKLFCVLRNSQISVNILLQSVTMLKNSCRANSNIIIFRKFNQKNIIEDYVMKHYLAGFPPFALLPKMQDKVNLYMRVTNKHDYFVLDVLNNTLTIHHETEL